MRPVILALFWLCVASAHFLESSLFSDIFTARPRHRRHEQPADIPVPRPLFMQEVGVSARLEYYSIVRSFETRPRGEVREALRDWAARHGVADSYHEYAQQEQHFKTKMRGALREALTLLPSVLAKDNSEDDLSRNMLQVQEDLDRSLDEASSDLLVRKALRQIVYRLIPSDPRDSNLFGEIEEQEFSDVLGNPPQPRFMQEVAASARIDYYRIADSYAANATMTRSLLEDWAETNNVTDSFDEFITSNQQFVAVVRRLQLIIMNDYLPSLWRKLLGIPSHNRSLSQDTLEHRTILSKLDPLTQHLYQEVEKTVARSLVREKTIGNVFLQHPRISEQREEDEREEMRRREKEEEERRDREWQPDEQRLARELEQARETRRQERQKARQRQATLEEWEEERRVEEYENGWSRLVEKGHWGSVAGKVLEWIWTVLLWIAIAMGILLVFACLLMSGVR